MPTECHHSISVGRWHNYATPTQTVWDRLVETNTHRDLTAIVGFCAIGLLITTYFILSFPNFSEMVESLQQFL
jgi:hypothetical protein